MPRTAHLLVFAATVALMLALVPAASAASQVAGVQAHLLWGGVSSAAMDDQLDAVQRSGAKVVRVDVGWQTAESAGKGRWAQWYLDEIDAVVAKANARGLRPLFTLLWSPCWASSAPESIKQGCSDGWWERGVGAYPPREAGDYADALGFLAKRYRGRVGAWEVWNEPNLDQFWKTGDQAGEYARLLKAAYPAAKAAAPGTPVLGGAVSESDVEFVASLYRRGVEGSFDALSIHPYSHDYSPLRTDSPYGVRSSFADGVPAVRAVMVRNGDRRPMWLTELGYSTSTVRGGKPWTSGVSEATQATYLRQAFARMSTWDFVEVGIVYNLVDKGTNGADRESNFGLLRSDLSEKPGYHALRDGVAALRGARTAATPRAAASPRSTAPGRRAIGRSGRGGAASTVATRGVVLSSVTRCGRSLCIRGRAPRSTRVRVTVRPAPAAQRAARGSGMRRDTRVRRGRFGLRVGVGARSRAAHRVTVQGLGPRGWARPVARTLRAR